MSKIDVIKEHFCKFLELCSLQNNLEIKELLIQMEPTKVSATANDSNKTVITSGTLTGSFADWGELGITNLPILKKFMSTSQVKLALKKTDNKLICESGRTKYSGNLVNSKYMDNNVLRQKFTGHVANASGNEFTLKSDNIKQIIDYFNTVKPKKFEIFGKDKVVTFKFASDQQEVETDFDISETISPFTVKVSDIFIDLLNTLGGFDLTFSIKTGAPIYIRIASPEIKFEYIFAPLAK